MDEEPFFIGWAPASASTVRSAVWRGGAAIAVMLLLGALLAASMRSPGEGLRSLLPGQRMVGLLDAEPNGVLWVIDEDETVHAVLLSSQGRSAIGPEARALDGHIVALSGNLLEREGRRMIEVGAAEEATLPAADEARLRSLVTESLGTLTLEGELVDSKCYLGRMRPGAGRTHRACAQSCVGGGVPPLLVIHDPSERHVLLEREDGGSIRLELLPFLTEPVAIEGEVTRVEDLLVVRTRADRIRRL